MKIGVFTFVALLAFPIYAQSQESCDRDCLEGYVDRYLNAMMNKKIDPKLFARDTKFTENGIRMPLGNEGLWFGMSGKGTYQFYVPDVETQQVAFIGTARENMRGTPDGETKVAIGLRLKIANGLISEVEQLVMRPEVNLFGGDDAGSSSPFLPTAEAVEAMGSPHAVFKEIIPEGKRPSREQLIKDANYYFSGLQQNDGKGYYPFTDDCDRFENGMAVLANVMDPETQKRGPMTCKRQFEVALKGVVDRVRDRRFVAVDRERGIVFAFAFFDHPQINWTWQLAELFKMEDGMIRRIEAVFHQAPYGIQSGWSTYEQGMSDQIQSVK